MQNKEAIYAEHILPLITQIYNIAKEHSIPFVFAFQTSDDRYEHSAYIPPTANKEMLQLWQLLEQE